MIKVIISGYGKMGHMVEKELAKQGLELVEASENIAATDPAIAKECVCIDFTTPDAFKANYKFIAQPSSRQHKVHSRQGRSWKRKS